MLNPVAPPDVVLLVDALSEDAEDWMLATCVPAKAKKRNMVVPTNSPMVATKSVQELEIVDNGGQKTYDS